jgi:DNA-binding IclR family transcriptional regulator
MSEARSGSRAIERALAVLDCFAGQTELTLSEVAAQTGLPVSTTYRIMQALLRGRFLEREETDVYRIGGRISELLPRRTLVDEVAPHLYALAAGIKITVSFGVLDDTALSVLLSARPPVRYCAAQVPGEREPLHATAMGKTLMAFHPGGFDLMSRRLGELTAYTSRTHTSRSTLLAELGEVRRSGFAVADEERAEGVRGVAVPVFGPDRCPVGSIGVQARPERLSDELVRSLVPAMRHFANEVTHRLSEHNLMIP